MTGQWKRMLPRIQTLLHEFLNICRRCMLPSVATPRVESCKPVITGSLYSSWKHFLYCTRKGSRGAAVVHDYIYVYNWIFVCASHQNQLQKQDGSSTWHASSAQHQDANNNKEVTEFGVATTSVTRNTPCKVKANVKYFLRIQFFFVSNIYNIAMKGYLGFCII